MTMTNQQTAFWLAIETAQARILSGDMARAMQAIQEARQVAHDVGGRISAQRAALIDDLSRMIAPDQLPSPSYPTAPIPVQQASASEPDRVQTDAAPARRIMVSGIGRSGTTLIYQQLANLLLLDSPRINFRYEPYLWNIRAPMAKGNPFDMSQLHNFGLAVHTATPLCHDKPDDLHDSFIDHLFNEAWDDDPAQMPDGYLTKVIRGSGRLRAYLKRYPDLRIVACLRNPIDTINSSLGMFSFFGEEFHRDDRARFSVEHAARGADVSQLDAPGLAIEWYAAWWRAFTEETLAVAADHPDNVMLFCYEKFQQKPDEALETLMDFVGVRNLGMFMGLSKPAGPSIKATSLTQHDIRVMKPQIAYYTDTILKPRLGEQAAAAHADKVVSRYLGSRFSFPTAGSDLGRRTPIQLRGMILNKGKSPFMSLVQRPAHPVSLDALIARHHPDNPGKLRRPAAAGDALKAGKTFGAVITCYNNASTIVDAVLSCLNQTLPFDQIVVVNDKSTDGSAQILAELGDRYSSVTVLHLPSNLGPSAGRDLGIRRLTADFFTQLDGDDLFWPTKNAQEVAAVAGDKDVVAFSDILLVRPGASAVQSTATYGAQSGPWAWQALLSRTPQIPRDMTVSRESYFRAGGYDMTRHLYEDWDFKLRLAMVTKTWIRAEGVAGTIYNRLTPGLSGVEDGAHARALSEIFLAAMRHAGDLTQDTVLAAYDAAMGRFKDRHVASSSRHALETCLARGTGLAELSEMVASRNLRASTNLHYVQALEAFAGSVMPARVDA